MIDDMPDVVEWNNPFTGQWHKTTRAEYISWSERNQAALRDRGIELGEGHFEIKKLHPEDEIMETIND